MAYSGKFAHCIRLRYHKTRTGEVEKNRKIRKKKGTDHIFTHFSNGCARLHSVGVCFVTGDTPVLQLTVWCCLCACFVPVISMNSARALLRQQDGAPQACLPLCGLMCPHSTVTGSFVDIYAFLCVCFTLTCLVERGETMQKVCLDCPVKKGNRYRRSCTLEYHNPLLCCCCCFVLDIFGRHEFCIECESVALEMTTS